MNNLILCRKNAFSYENIFFKKTLQNYNVRILIWHVANTQKQCCEKLYLSFRISYNNRQKNVNSSMKIC